MTSNHNVHWIDADELRRQLLDGGEIALIDIREGDAHAAGHISVSVPIADSDLELEIGTRVPRRDTRVVLADADGGDAVSGAVARLVSLGYTAVSALSGGVNAWAQNGGELITQPNALSKALGEFIERHYHTPRITVEELKKKLDDGEDIVLIDTRPKAEYEAIHLPTGQSAPGAELLFRVFDQVTSPDQQVVVNCAGRTRAIIGAQALINAGISNPVVSVENGTSAWRFAGYEPATGPGDIVPAPSEIGLARAVEAAERIRARFGITVIDADQLAQFSNEPQRTLYLLDIRTPEEYAQAHLPGSLSAPGGQVVQATDLYVGTRNARVVLVDSPDQVRSSITASWLLQLGLDDVHIYGADAQQVTESGHPRQELALTHGAVTVSPSKLKSDLGAGKAITIIDLQGAPAYYETRRFIAGSLVARRSSLLLDPKLLSDPLDSGEVVFVSGDGELAKVAAVELSAATGQTIFALDGGIDAWAEAGLPFQTGVGQIPLTESDELPKPVTLEQNKATFAHYVAWGDHVIDQLKRDGLVTFRAYENGQPVSV